MNKADYFQLEKNEQLPELAELRSPKSLIIITFVMLVIFIVIVLVMIFMPWLQTVFGTVKIIAYTPLERQQNIETPIEGRIIKWFVQEGTNVKKGQLIAEVSDNDPQYFERLRQQRDFQNDAVKAAKDRAQAFSTLIYTLEQSRRNAVDAAGLRVKMANERIIAAENQLAASKASYDTAKLNMERQKALDETGLTSTRTVELAALELTRTETELQRSKAALNAAKNEMKALISDRQKIDKDGNASIVNARASYASAMSDIARATTESNRIDITISRQENQVIKSPRNGTILRLLVNQGTEMVRSGEGIAVLVPDTDKRAVELLVSGNDIPLVEKSERVRLQLEGWPALQFNGWPSVAVGTFSGKVAFTDSTDNGKGKFRVVVLPDGNKPWPDKKYLKQGVRAKGWIMINQVPLWFELWRQFNGFPPVIANDDEKETTDDVIKRKEKKN